MLRNVVVGRVHAGVGVEAIEAALQGIRGLTVDGVGERVQAGVDLGLREDPDSGGSFAITLDFPDEASYRRYDTDPEHNRVRRELFAPICASITRVQFRLPD